MNTVSGTSSKKRMMRSKRNDIAWGYLFLAPMLVGYGLFFVFPLGSAVVMSFSTYDLFHPMKMIGFQNYIAAFHDAFFWRAMLNVLLNATGVLIGMVIALVLAALITSTKRGSMFFRSVYFLPTICGSVAITFIWQWMYAPSYGLINSTLHGLFGTKNIMFLSDLFIPSMIFMGVWSGFGVSLLLYYAALKNAPASLYEAAAIDGANAFQKFRHITLALVSPTTFYILITGLAGAFQVFTQFQVMSGGAFNEKRIVPVWWIYNFMGSYGYEYGYAAALGIILGLIIIAFSAVQFVASRRWVSYDA
jgi:multiple sugar transport system permease protein